MSATMFRREDQGYSRHQHFVILEGWRLMSDFSLLSVDDGVSAHCPVAQQERAPSASLIPAEKKPPIGSFSGHVLAIESLGGDVVELVISTDDQMKIMPGQYVQACFTGFPARSYSPTVALKGAGDSDTLRLHVQRTANGRVSNALGAAIKPGHSVEIVGPYGEGYLRPGATDRLVLVASGVGFAPIWSIAHAALRENPDREMVVIVVAKDRGGLYMAPTLVRLAACANVRVIPVVPQIGRLASAAWIGNPLVFMPRLSSSDIVYASGAPLMVEGVASIAQGAGARCYADPFIPAEQEAA